MTYWNGQLMRKGTGGVGQQRPIMPKQTPMAPMALGVHQQPTQASPKILTHVHSGAADPHPIALRHSAAHTDPYHKDEDKLVDAFMKLTDLANDGKATPEHMGQMDGIKIQLAQIQQKRTDEVQRLNQFMRQGINADEQDASPGARMPGGEQELPVGGAEGVKPAPRPGIHKDMNDSMGDSGSVGGANTLPQVGKAIGTLGGWYTGGLDYMQKQVETRTPESRKKFGTKSDYAMPGSAGGITPPQSMDSASSTRPQGGTAKPAKSVFQKGAMPMFGQSRLNNADNQPVTEAVATIAPDEAGDPATTFGKVGSAEKTIKAPAVPELSKSWYGRQGPV